MHFEVELLQVFPRAGWVEMDALEIINSVEQCIEEACNKLKQSGRGDAGAIRAVGISNQRGRKKVLCVTQRMAGKVIDHKPLLFIPPVGCH
jgi:glycerol kinase